MAKKKSAAPVYSSDRETHNWIRSTIRELDTRYDREALALLYGPAGALAADDPSVIAEAVDRLYDEDAVVEKRNLAAQERAVTAKDEKTRGEAVAEMEDIEVTRQSERTDVAYLLGIAVGRRLSSAATPRAGLRLRKGGA